MMKVTSINIGSIQHYPWRNGTESAILKQPVSGVIALNELGFEGDEQGDTKAHGGAEKAVMVIPEGNYARFEIKQPFGYLGENITLFGADESQIALGDQLQIGEALLEVTQPRSPCWKLNALSNDNTLLSRYADSGHVGFYCRVLKMGEILAGQDVFLIPCETQPRILIKALFLAQKNAKTAEDKALLQAALIHPALSLAWQKNIQSILARF